MRLAPALVALALLPLSLATAQDEGLPLPRPKQRLELVGEAKAALGVIRQLDAGTAEQTLAAAYDRLWTLDPAQLDLSQVDADPPAAIQALFAVSLALDDKMAELYAAGQLSDAIANAKRRVLRAVRYLRERVILRAHEQGLPLYGPQRPLLASEPPPQPGFDHYHWTLNPAYADLPLEPGRWPRTFFIMNEGDMTLSAAISRATSEDNMFSHYSIGIITDHEQTVDGHHYPAGTVLTLESLIEKGVVIHPFPFHFNKALGTWSAREAILFLRDPAQQAAVDAAADEFFNRARDAINAGRPLGYDFTMGSGMVDALGGGGGGKEPPRLLDLDKYFCSGVADAIGQAAGVPLFTNRSLMEQSRNTRELVASWGLDPDRQVATPGDGDVSAALVRVAEGVNLDDILVTHYRHSILNAMFRWMGQGYRVSSPRAFQEGTKVVTEINDETAHTILDLGLVPDGMTPAIMDSLIPMHLAAQKFLKRLRKRDEQALKEQGRRLTPRELDAYLDEIRPQVNVDLWFVPSPAGEYKGQIDDQLPWAKGGQVELSIVRDPQGDDFTVTRRVRRGGELVASGQGRGHQQGMKLTVDFSERSGAQQQRMRYTLGRDGSIRAVVGVFVWERSQRQQ